MTKKAPTVVLEKPKSVRPGQMWLFGSKFKFILLVLEVGLYAGNYANANYAHDSTYMSINPGTNNIICKTYDTWISSRNTVEANFDTHWVHHMLHPDNDTYMFLGDSDIEHRPIESVSIDLTVNQE